MIFFLPSQNFNEFISFKNKKKTKIVYKIKLFQECISVFIFVINSVNVANHVNEAVHEKRFEKPWGVESCRSGGILKRIL